ncbi:hypothetical protein NQ318_023651 [Aromia moschata]|uniref:Uncharacterized protein n=1 Tax=Aromia moschata TaxID=1265417 RepID=A0AAV8X143_9CUCU|nr:hypothetical protein NQ318_023651 [Aromia moschata]
MRKNAHIKCKQFKSYLKMIQIDELEFCDLLMTCIDQNQLSLEWIVSSEEATFTLNEAQSGERRGGAICNVDKMKIFLRYVGDPGFQTGVGEDIGVHQTSVSKVVTEDDLDPMEPPLQDVPLPYPAQGEINNNIRQSGQRERICVSRNYSCSTLRCMYFTSSITICCKRFRSRR